MSHATVPGRLFTVVGDRVGGLHGFICPGIAHFCEKIPSGLLETWGCVLPFTFISPSTVSSSWLFSEGQSVGGDLYLFHLRAY